jgi:hypothetical protein
MEPAIVRASNEAIVRRDGDGEKVRIGREGGERIPGFEVAELERLVPGSGQRGAAIRTSLRRGALATITRPKASIA